MSGIKCSYLCTFCGSTMIRHERFDVIPCFNCGEAARLYMEKELGNMETPKTQNQIRRELGFHPIDDEITTGKLYSFEGPECSGKSTSIQKVKDILQANGYDVVVTREPGGTALAEKMRELAFDKVHDKTELLLMCAAREEHYQELIRPALESGKIVLCDRHMDSTTVYQFLAKGKTYEEAVEWHDFIFPWGVIKPAQTFLIDIPSEEIMKRLEGRGVENKFDAKGEDYHELIRYSYLTLPIHEPERFIVINGMLNSGWIADYISTWIMRDQPAQETTTVYANNEPVMVVKSCEQCHRPLPSGTKQNICLKCFTENNLKNAELSARRQGEM